MLTQSDVLIVVLIALVTDAVIGDPDAVWRRWPHPVTWIGWVIGWLDRAMNRDTETFAKRKIMGCVALMLISLITGALAFALDTALRALPGHPWTSGILASVLIAQNSLYVHVARVRDAFGVGGLVEARKAVSMIVGRNPESLDEAGVARATIETTAENFSDGVVAPVFWFAILGLPGLVLYKAINTADSMIGHRTARHEAFGWAAARLDDWVNLIPARFAGLLVAFAAPLAEGSVVTSLKIMWRDAGLHKSPNAGWPEAAMAGALGIALAGPRQYGEQCVDDTFLHAEGRRQATPFDITRALRVLIGACALQIILLVALALIWAD